MLESAARLALITALIALPKLAPTQELTSEEQRIRDYIHEHFEDAVTLLERSVNINSGSLNAEGVRQVGQVFQAELDDIGFDTRWITFDESIERGGHLFAETKGTQGKRLLLIGHLDTVFEKDSPFQRFERSGDTAHGPGVSDMKGGDVRVAVVQCRAVDATEAQGRMVLWVTEPTDIDNTTG